MIKDSQIIRQIPVPAHVAVIMDGNGRWAKERGQERIFGHVNGVESVREVLKAATEAGVKFLTLYAFSTENQSRPKEEVDALMNLLVSTILTETQELHNNNVKLNAIGDLSQLPNLALTNLSNAIEQTAKNSGVILSLALYYSSRWEITEALKKLSSKAKSDQQDFDQQDISDALSTKNLPDPELIIRTGGEKRLSNFLLWQAAYAELYFTDVLWPDFRKRDFEMAIEDFAQRERRFGKTSEQLSK